VSQPGTARACGYALANKGHGTRAIQGWLGHWSITSTAVYTALAPEPDQGLLAVAGVPTDLMNATQK
jgi:integrase